MSDIAIALIAAVIFVIGIFAGLLATVSYGVRREDQRYTLPGEPPSLMARGVRRVIGVGFRSVRVRHPGR
jgi:hypothetical protein